MPATRETRIGRIAGWEGPYLRVNCFNMPFHSRVLYLLPWQVRSAKVGDKVMLAYRASASRGDWVVTEILTDVEA